MKAHPSAAILAKRFSRQFPFHGLATGFLLLGFTFLLALPAHAQKKDDEITDPLEKDLLEFASIELQIDGKIWKDTAHFPQLVWEHPDRVRELIGDCPLRTRWFDAKADEVQEPDGKAPYVAYLEGQSGKCGTVRRLITVSPEGAAQTHFPHPSIESSFDETQWMVDEQQIAVKRKILGVENTYPALKPPHQEEAASTTLHPGTPEQAGFKPESIEAMRQAARHWYENDHEPCVVCVARHGIVVFHEAFDDPRTGKTTVDTPKHMASITKTISACLFAEFMDQGLVGLDDPIGKILPDFPITGDKMITWRATFMHTAGIHIKAGDGREVHNAWSDNWAANLIPCLKIGAQHKYNNMDTELTAKAMELMTGASVLRRMKEDLFVPLGMDHSRGSDVCHGAECTAMDAAKLGQMLLNQGSYGHTRFFSKETFQKMLPTQLHAHWPQAKFDLPWGMGLTYFRERDPRAGTGDTPKNKTLLSKMTFCHGASSGAVLRVDPVNDVVVTLVRAKIADNYKENLAQFLLAVDEGIVDRRP